MTFIIFFLFIWFIRKIIWHPVTNRRVKSFCCPLNISAKCRTPRCRLSILMDIRLSDLNHLTCSFSLMRHGRLLAMPPLRQLHRHLMFMWLLLLVSSLPSLSAPASFCCSFVTGDCSVRLSVLPTVTTTLDQEQQLSPIKILVRI